MPQGAYFALQRQRHKVLGASTSNMHECCHATLHVHAWLVVMPDMTQRIHKTLAVCLMLTRSVHLISHYIPVKCATAS